MRIQEEAYEKEVNIKPAGRKYGILSEQMCRWKRNSGERFNSTLLSH